MFCNRMDCSPSGSSVHGISKARILEWVAVPFSTGSSWPRDWACISCLAGGFFTTKPAGKPHLQDYPKDSWIWVGSCMRAGTSELAEGSSSPTAEGWEGTDSDMTLRVSATCTLHQELTANWEHSQQWPLGFQTRNFPDAAAWCSPFERKSVAWAVTEIPSMTERHKIIMKPEIPTTSWVVLEKHSSKEGSAQRVS